MCSRGLVTLCVSVAGQKTSLRSVEVEVDSCWPTCCRYKSCAVSTTPRLPVHPYMHTATHRPCCASSWVPLRAFSRHSPQTGPTRWVCGHMIRNFGASSRSSSCSLAHLEPNRKHGAFLSERLAPFLLGRRAAAQEPRQHAHPSRNEHACLSASGWPSCTSYKEFSTHTPLKPIQ